MYYALFFVGTSKYQVILPMLVAYLAVTFLRKILLNITAAIKGIFYLATSQK